MPIFFGKFADSKEWNIVNSHLSGNQKMTGYRTKDKLGTSCNSTLINHGQGNFMVKGNVECKTVNPFIIYWASLSDDIKKYYPDPFHSYKKTPNIGKIPTKNGKFHFKIDFPTDYWEPLFEKEKNGKVKFSGRRKYQPSHVHIKVCEPGGLIHTLELGNKENFLKKTSSGYNYLLLIIIVGLLILLVKK